MLMLSPLEAKLLCTGQYIAAIKSVRDRLGLGLGEAKAFVDECLEEMGYTAHDPCHACAGRGFTTVKSSEYLALMESGRTPTSEPW